MYECSTVLVFKILEGLPVAVAERHQQLADNGIVGLSRFMTVQLLKDSSVVPHLTGGRFDLVFR